MKRNGATARAGQRAWQDAGRSNTLRYQRRFVKPTYRRPGPSVAYVVRYPSCDSASLLKRDEPALLPPPVRSTNILASSPACTARSRRFFHDALEADIAGEQHPRLAQAFSQADVRPSPLHWYAKCCSRIHGCCESVRSSCLTGCRRKLDRTWCRCTALARRRISTIDGGCRPHRVIGTSAVPRNHWQMAGRPKRLCPNS